MTYSRTTLSMRDVFVDYENVQPHEAEVTAATGRCSNMRRGRSSMALAVVTGLQASKRLTIDAADAVHYRL